MGIRIGAAGKKESYATLNTIAKTTERIVGKMAKDQVSQSMGGNVESAELIPNPTYGYMMGGLLGHEKMDDGLYNELIERGFARLAYVGRLGRNSSAEAFMCDLKDCDCMYHMEYTRGYGKRCGDCAPLAALYVGKVSTQKDILDKQLEEGDMSAGERAEIQIELGIIHNRWETWR